MPLLEWVLEEEKYLALLHKSSMDLSKSYKDLYLASKATQNRYRFPAIVMSSVSGLASFGTTTFPEGARFYVSIAVGCVNIFIAILNTWEAFTKVAEIVNQSLLVSNSFKKLADDIHCELSVPVADRETSGITYLRDSFTRYQQILDQAPPLDNEIPTDMVIKMLRRDITDALKDNQTATYSFQQTPKAEEADDPRNIIINVRTADVVEEAASASATEAATLPTVVLSRGLKQWQNKKAELGIVIPAQP